MVTILDFTNVRNKYVTTIDLTAILFHYAHWGTKTRLIINRYLCIEIQSLAGSEKTK